MNPGLAFGLLGGFPRTGAGWSPRCRWSRSSCWRGSRCGCCPPAAGWDGVAIGLDLRRRRRQPDRPRAVRRRRGLRRRALARLALARLQRRRLGDHRGRGAAGLLPHRRALARPAPASRWTSGAGGRCGRRRRASRPLAGRAAARSSRAPGCRTLIDAATAFAWTAARARPPTTWRPASGSRSRSRRSRPRTLEPEPIALTVVHEDEHVLVLDKPAGMVVHPGAGHARGTLAAAVLAHAPGTARRRRTAPAGRRAPSGQGHVGAPGRGQDGRRLRLAHRPARSPGPCGASISRSSTAACAGAEGVVDRPIGRDPHDRTRMAVRPAGQGRRAVTRWRVLERFADFTYLEARLRDRPDAPDPRPPGLPGPPGRGRRACTAGAVVRRCRSRSKGSPCTPRRWRSCIRRTGQLVEFTSALPARIERLLSHLRHARSP